MAREGVNKVTLVGNLGADPELTYTGSGTARLRLRVATTERWFDKSTNEKKEQTEWHSVILWGKRAEALNKFLSKGETVYIEGSIHYKELDGDNGKKYFTDIKAHDLKMLGSKRDGNGGGNRSGGGDFGGGGGQNFGGGGYDDDVPFAEAW